VEKYSAVLEKSDSELKAVEAQYTDSFNKLFQDGKALGVAENKYTHSTVEELTTLVEEVKTAAGKRSEAYRQELEKQRANDALCKAFAALAVPFAKALNASKSAISDSKDTLEKQLEVVTAVHASADKKEGAALPEINKAQEQLDKAGITNNTHTLLTFRDCEVQYQQYLAFLGRKKKQLEDEIQHKKLRGVTPEQYKEIETQFKQFDSNSNGTLDTKEFRRCLYSLGYEYDGQTIEKIMKQFGAKPLEEKGVKGGVVMGYDAFKEFMINNLGDNDTKDEILVGFKLVSGHKDYADPAILANVMTDETIKFIEKEAPKKDKGYDYVALTNKLFAR